MLIKAGVDISRLNRNIRRALEIVNHHLKIWDFELIITSTYEGNHSPGSLHYANDAFDFRTPDFNVGDHLKHFKSSLGDDFDVVKFKDHIHIEYDPEI